LPMTEMTETTKTVERTTDTSGGGPFKTIKREEGQHHRLKNGPSRPGLNKSPDSKR